MRTCDIEDAEPVIARLRERGLSAIVESIAKDNFVTLVDACARSRLKPMVKARHEAWRHLRGLGMSYPFIAQLWDVDHTTVFHAIHKLDAAATSERRSAGQRERHARSRIEVA